ncbi:MAG: 5-formyltetrahydrofolate cyclo-ligase [Bacillota bacterium]
MDKNELRKTIKAIALLDRHDKSHNIVSCLLALAELKKSTSVFMFMGDSREPDLSYLIKHSTALQKECYVPVTTDIIRFARVDEYTTLERKKYGILEPQLPNYTEITPDIIIVPMVACDKNGGRLGHGKGYYDRFLADKNIYKVGVTFSDFIVSDTFCCAHDIKMDIIITDKGILE